MKSDLKAKFIQYLNHDKNDQGFTLVELLVVIIIIGILAAIALPNFLNQTAKAKQTEAKQNVGLVNKIQNTYREEHKSFASTFNILAIGSITGTTNGTTQNYSYDITGTTDTATITATALDTSLKGYSGAVIRYDNGTSQSVIGTVLCEMLINGTIAAAPPDISNVSAPPQCNNSVHTTLSL